MLSLFRFPALSGIQFLWSCLLLLVFVQFFSWLRVSSLLISLSRSLIYLGASFPRFLYLSGCLRSAGGPSSSFLWVILPFPWCCSSLLRSGAFLFLLYTSPLIVVSGVFQLLSSLGLLPNFPCAVLSFIALLDGRPSFPFLFSLGVHGSPSSSYPSCSALHFILFKRSSASVVSPVPSTTGSSLWAESVVPIGVSHSLLVVCPSLILRGFCFSLLLLLFFLGSIWVLSRVAHLFFVHVLLLS